jgi:hypothetical protein
MVAKKASKEFVVILALENEAKITSPNIAIVALDNEAKITSPNNTTTLTPA